MARTESHTRPLADYTVPVNELLDSGIAEVEAFGRNYMRKIFGIPSPPPTALNTTTQPSTPPKSSIEPPDERRSHVLPLSQILAPQTPPPMPLKRDRRDSEVSEVSDEEDEEKRIHATFLLNLASPEATSRTTSELHFPVRKRVKSRYADSMNIPLSQMVRPAFEFMGEAGPSLSGARYIPYPYSAPHSPPQSPPESLPRPRARPGHCARKAQGCNEGTKFRPVISDWTCYKNYEPCPKDSQVGWCNKCWCNKGHYSEEDFFRRKFDLLEDQIAVWAEEFHVAKFEVWLPSQDNGASPSLATTKSVIDAETAKRYVLRWREEWERTGRTPTIKIRPV